jgi:hypothetical protein
MCVFYRLQPQKNEETQQHMTVTGNKTDVSDSNLGNYWWFWVVPMNRKHIDGPKKRKAKPKNYCNEGNTNSEL